MTAAHFRNALQMQSMLLEYRIEQVLGAGGFGITYRARDSNLDKDGDGRIWRQEFLQAKRIMLDRRLQKSN